MIFKMGRTLLGDHIFSGTKNTGKEKLKKNPGRMMVVWSKIKS